MRFRQFVLALVAMLALTALLAPVADAKNTKESPRAITRHAKLVATDAGKAVDAKGHGKTYTKRSVEEIGVWVVAGLPDGAVLTVEAARADGVAIAIGTITLREGEGKLKLSNRHGDVLPDGVSPVKTLKTLTVKDADGNVLLEGTFRTQK